MIFHEEHDGWWAESPDMPRYTACAPTEQSLRALVHEGVPFYFEDDLPFEIVEEHTAATPV
jgi:predicted RNase H-like HicB family nuclease